MKKIIVHIDAAKLAACTDGELLLLSEARGRGGRFLDEATLNAIHDEQGARLRALVERLAAQQLDVESSSPWYSAPSQDEITAVRAKGD